MSADYFDGDALYAYLAGLYADRPEQEDEQLRECERADVAYHLRNFYQAKSLSQLRAAAQETKDAPYALSPRAKAILRHVYDQATTNLQSVGQAFGGGAPY